MKDLRSVHLVDAYSESIWGPRLRRSDIEFVAIQSLGGDKPFLDSKGVSNMTSNEIIDNIRNIVICEAKTERIIGGDRVEDRAALL